jgi:hypothetical protein
LNSHSRPQEEVTSPHFSLLTKKYQRVDPTTFTPAIYSWQNIEWQKASTHGEQLSNAHNHDTHGQPKMGGGHKLHTQ